MEKSKTFLVPQEDPTTLRPPPCFEYNDFEKYLRDSRKLDDNIIFTLNKTTGSSSDCEKVYTTLQNVYLSRENAIRKCLTSYNEAVASGTATALDRAKFRQLQSELDVEYILKMQSTKQIRTRCREFRPEDPKPPTYTT